MPWILISVLIVLILLAIVAVWFKKKNKRPTDYFTLFIIGIIWMGFGIPLKNYALSVAGTFLMVIGLVNKGKWDANRIHWSDLTEEEKKMRKFIMVVLGILLLAGFILWYYKAI